MLGDEKGLSLFIMGGLAAVDVVADLVLGRNHGDLQVGVVLAAGVDDVHAVAVVGLAIRTRILSTGPWSVRTTLHCIRTAGAR